MRFMLVSLGISISKRLSPAPCGLPVHFGPPASKALPCTKQGVLSHSFAGLALEYTGINIGNVSRTLFNTVVLQSLLA